MTNLEALLIQHKTERTLLTVRQALDVFALKEKGDADKMLHPEVADLIAKFDTATNAIAARIQGLISSQGLSAEDKAALQTEVDNLTALGADPANPVP